MNERLAFTDDEFDGQFMRTLQAAAVGAADLGEAFTTARTIGNRYRPDRWYRHWLERTESVRDIAERAHVAGHLVSAHQAYLRASEYYRQAYFFLRADLDDQRLRNAYQAHVHAFGKAMDLLGHTGSPVVADAVDIPYDDGAGVHTGLHAWLFQARPEGTDTTGRRRPTIVMPCGYDSTAESGWGSAQGALARGYDVLSVEGPGQDASLVVDRLYFRPDYEVVLSQILDWLVAAPDVDTARIAVVGRSFSGYLAPRGVAGETRVAALVCDPAQPDMGAKIPDGWKGRVAVPLMTALSRVSRERADFFRSRMACHGLTAIGEFFAELQKFALTDRIAEIACPTMVVESAGDPVGGHGRVLFDALTAPGSAYVDPDPSTGISGHCGGLGQTAWDATVYDWLDETLAAGARPATTTREAHR
ncbi:alpha/beta hydrolase family protein [Gordonia sp. NPDC003376]